VEKYKVKTWQGFLDDGQTVSMPAKDRYVWLRQVFDKLRHVIGWLASLSWDM
jgi:hypothetical protein